MSNLKGKATVFIRTRFPSRSSTPAQADERTLPSASDMSTLHSSQALKSKAMKTPTLLVLLKAALAGVPFLFKGAFTVACYKDHKYSTGNNFPLSRT